MIDWRKDWIEQDIGVPDEARVISLGYQCPGDLCACATRDANTRFWPFASLLHRIATHHA
jgi:hypothetical protein